jgi:hypothetical protein
VGLQWDRREGSGQLQVVTVVAILLHIFSSPRPRLVSRISPVSTDEALGSHSAMKKGLELSPLIGARPDHINAVFHPFQQVSSISLALLTHLALASYAEPLAEGEFRFKRRK